MQVILLDVGHGNCAIVRSGDAIAVIDSPTGAVLLDTLRDMKIEVVDTAIISHSDKDHIAGILSILTSDKIRVRQVFVNPDSQKNTRIWRDFLVAAAVAERKGTCTVVPCLSTTSPGRIKVGAGNISVLCPTAALALAGVGGKAPSGRRLNANSLSGVLRIDTDDSAGSILLAADLDEVGLEEALEARTSLGADILVFPHHGGRPGNTAAGAFTTKLLGAVNPRAVVFSNGRARHDNPRPEVVEEVRTQKCYIACTQLSERCQRHPVDANDYLEPLRANGRNAGLSCAGSMTLELRPNGHRSARYTEQHQKFISDWVTSPMCKPPSTD